MTSSRRAAVGATGATRIARIQTFRAEIIAGKGAMDR
jgi:uncharacterized protein YdeI (YjbR/CyaY-like superfamily)